MWIFAQLTEEFTATPQEQKALTLMQAAIVDEDDFGDLNDAVIHAGEEEALTMRQV